MADLGLLAGVGRADITPPIGIELFGYHRGAPMADVRDPLSITALALVAGGPPAPEDRVLVILAVDHIGMGIAATARLRSAAAAAAHTTPERVAVCFSHTHSGPDSETLDWHGRERPADAPERVYRATLPTQAASATRLAMQRLASARAGGGMATSTAGVNRRMRGPDGRVVSNAVNLRGPLDQQVAVLRVDGVDGRPVAALVHYGIHGAVFRQDNLACSADVAGAVRATVEAATGAPCLFVQGAAGDVNPRWRGDDAALRRTGWELGGSALQALAAAETEPLEALDSATEVVRLRLMPLPDELEAARRAQEVACIWEAPTDAWLEVVRRKLAAGERHLALPLELQAVRVNDFVRVGIPMEPFAGLSLAFRERAASLGTADRPLCLAFGGYTNGLLGYLPTAEEHGGYEIEWMPVVYGFYEGLLTPPAPETGDEVVKAAVRLAARLCQSPETR